MPNHSLKQCVKYERIWVPLNRVFSHILRSEKFINFLQYIFVILISKNQYLQIYTYSHYCKYCVADAQNNEFLLKLF